MLYRIELPKIDYSVLPTVEREAASALFQRLLELDKHQRNFFAATILFESGVQFLIDYRKEPSADRVELSQLWKLIAARDGAMSAYHFHSALDSISGFAHLAPSLKEKMDQSAIKTQLKKFREIFRDVEKLRHAVAHSADRGKNLCEIKKNVTKTGVSSKTISVGGPGMEVLLDFALNGKKFSTMIDGKIYEYEISYRTAAALQNIERAVFRAISV